MKYLYLIIVVFMIISLNAQNKTMPHKIQNRVISDQQHFYFLGASDRSSYLQLFKVNHSQIDSTYTTAHHFKVLKNNPVAWYYKNSSFYYLFKELHFKGDFSLTINAIDLSRSKNWQPNYNPLELKKQDQNATKSFHLRTLHERKFHKEQLDSLYFDFTVQTNNDLFLVSYFDNQLCFYKSNATDSNLDFYGDQKIRIKAPFQIFFKDDLLYLKDAGSDMYTIKLDSFRLEKTENKLLETVPEFVGKIFSEKQTAPNSTNPLLINLAK